MPSPTQHKRDRLERCLAGAPLERPPVALWRHFPVDDQTPDGLAAATAHFQNSYDFDFIKVTPTSSFCIKDWGVEDRWMGNPEGTREYTHRAIIEPEDWERLSLLDPHSGYLGAQIECLRLLQGEFGSSVPYQQTIFSPMSQAKNLVGPELLLVHMRMYPDALHAGLRRITETTLRFLEACQQTGIAGIFYAVQHAQAALLSQDEFATFCRPYDQQILNAASRLWLNLLHIHGENILFDSLVDYPVQMINWHDQQTWPNLAHAKTRFAGVVCGGLRQWETMVLGTPQVVREEALEAIRAAQGTRFVLGTGCVLPTTAPRGNILAARAAVEG